MSSFCARLLSLIACECDLDICHFDVDQAFVPFDPEEDVFLRFRLSKHLYGLKQTSRT